MSARSGIFGVSALMLPVLAIAWIAPSYSADLPETETVLLVAKPELLDPIYRETILIARPIGQGRHLGVILNKPTKMSLAQAFPGHGPSKAVRGLLYLGGPAKVDAVFALVASHDRPGRGSMQLSPDLFPSLRRIPWTTSSNSRPSVRGSSPARLYGSPASWMKS